MTTTRTSLIGMPREKKLCMNVESDTARLTRELATISERVAFLEDIDRCRLRDMGLLRDQIKEMKVLLDGLRGDQQPSVYNVTRAE